MTNTIAFLLFSILTACVVYTVLHFVEPKVEAGQRKARAWLKSKPVVRAAAQK